jgi:class 3 adenylate cyclase
MERKLTTIIAMDVVGYSRLMEIDEQGTFDRLKDARLNIIDPSIARHSGRTVKLMGDGALAEFRAWSGHFSVRWRSNGNSRHATTWRTGCMDCNFGSVFTSAT